MFFHAVSKELDIAAQLLGSANELQPGKGGYAQFNYLPRLKGCKTRNVHTVAYSGNVPGTVGTDSLLGRAGAVCRFTPYMNSPLGCVTTLRLRSVHAETVASALIAAGYSGRSVAEVPLNVALVDFG